MALREPASFASQATGASDRSAVIHWRDRDYSALGRQGQERKPRVPIEGALDRDVIHLRIAHTKVA